MTHDLTEYRTGRNFIRVGHTVKVEPSRKGKRDGFIGPVVRIRANDAGEIVGVDVGGGTKRPGLHTVPVERITRIAQTRVEAKK